LRNNQTDTLGYADCAGLDARFNLQNNKFKLSISRKTRKNRTGRKKPDRSESPGRRTNMCGGSFFLRGSQQESRQDRQQDFCK